MGPLVTGLNLTTISTFANRCQKHFHFTVSDPIQSVGKPSDNASYTVDSLADALLNNRAELGDTVLIGVVDSEVGDKVFSSLDRKNRCIIISIDDVDSILKQTKTTLKGYVLVETAAQLLTLKYRRRVQVSIDPDACGEPWHEETRECLFDYCEKREHTGKKLMVPKICSHCQALFDKANMPCSVLMAGKKIFNAGVRRTILEIIDDVTKYRLVMFLVGALVTPTLRPILNNAGISAVQLLISGGIIFALIVLIVWISSNRRRMAKLQT